MFEEFGLATCNSTILLMMVGLRLIANMGALEVDAQMYQRMAGKLNFLIQT
jgi:hypothetical protein